jgi:hypothetical protein
MVASILLEALQPRREIVFLQQANLVALQVDLLALQLDLLAVPSKSPECD